MRTAFVRERARVALLRMVFASARNSRCAPTLTPRAATLHLIGRYKLRAACARRRATVSQYLGRGRPGKLASKFRRTAEQALRRDRLSLRSAL